MNITQTRLSPNRQAGGMREVRALMLHHTAGGTFASNMDYLNRPTTKASYHILIGKNGEIGRLANDNDRAWHAGTSPRALTLTSGKVIPQNMGNDHTIGISLVNAGNGSDPFPPAQLAALDSVLAFYRGRFGNLPIIDHKMYRPGNGDMASNFPLAHYIAGGGSGNTSAPSTPTPPAPPAGRATIRRGSSGADVRHAQTRLNVHGAKLTVDGAFGANTDSAVRAFQKARNLVVDGIVGANTWRALDGAPSGSQAPTPAPTQPAGFRLTRQLRQGSSGEDVRALQRRLITLGYGVGAAGADGHFGANTNAAVVRFQRDKKLTADGIVGANTARALGWTFG